MLQFGHIFGHSPFIPMGIIFAAKTKGKGVDTSVLQQTIEPGYLQIPNQIRIDTMYRRNLSITITSNFTLKELGELEKVHPSFIRRIDEICRVLEV
jgi:hypothetical protein